MALMRALMEQVTIEPGRTRTTVVMEVALPLTLPPDWSPVPR